MILKDNWKLSDVPRISVITPSLNQGPFIEQTIRSVIDQAYANLEYIIIDGGSRDDTVRIIKKYADRLSYWCSEPDSGQSHAINKGLERATGDIVAYLCSDDQYLPGTLDLVAKTFTRFPEKTWLAGICKYCPLGGAEYPWIPEPPPKDRVLLVCGPWGTPQPANFWRRQLFSVFGPFREDLNYVMDTEFQVRLVLGGEVPVIVEEELAYSVLHPECKSVKKESQQLYEQGRFLQLFWEQMTAEEQLRGRIALCFRESGVAAKLGKTQAVQWLLYFKGLCRAFGISPGWTLRRLCGALRRRLVKTSRFR